MNKLILVFSLCTVPLSGNAQTYIFGKIGSASIETQQTQASSEPFNSPSIGVGFKFNKYLGVESEIGEINIEDASTPTYSLSAIGRLPLVPGLVARAKLGGIHSTYTKANSFGATSGTAVGLGMELNITNSFSLVTELEHFTPFSRQDKYGNPVKFDFSTNKVNLGVQYSF